MTRDTVRALVGAVLGGLVIGALTAYGQGTLPGVLGPLANSVGAWSLPAFLLALLAPNRPVAALAGFLALACMLAGYVVTNELRGFPSSLSLLVFWGGAALLAGPLLGLVARWLRDGRAPWAAVGAGAIGGVLVGDGLYGLTYVAATTSPPYWWGEVVVGVVLLAGVAAWRLRRPRAVALATAVTAVTAAAFVLLFPLSGRLFFLL